MIRNAPRRRILLAVVIVLTSVLAAPIDECDDYAFLSPGAATAHAAPDDHAADDCDRECGDGAACRHVCSCLLCVLTTDDSFPPRIPSPERAGAVAPTFQEHDSPGYLPAVYHPPNA